MMGTGKTSVGRLLGRRLGWRFIDTDERVEAHAAVPVRTIFERDGEARFRELERAVLEELPARRAVIALGGGAVVAAENRTLLRDKGTLVWLDAAPEIPSCSVVIANPTATETIVSSFSARRRMSPSAWIFALSPM